MHKTYLIIVTTLISLCMLSCNSDNTEQGANTKSATPSFDKQWAKSFIDSINTKFTGQFRVGDSVALASHYWPDAEILLSNSEAIKGNDILPAWGSMTRMGIKDFTFSTTDIKGDSEFLIETGNYEMKDEKKTLIDKGKYVVVWQQRNGEWKLYRDIGNTSLPASK
jgi:ketosteroid isomerase-like protein